MARNNTYWLSHDQVALIKTFHGTASRCKQTINHAVPRIKQLSSLLYDFLLHCKNHSRIHPKIWLPVPIPYTQYWLPMPILFQQLTTSVNIPNFPQYWIHVPTLVPQKERERKEAGIASAEFMEGERSLYKRTSFRCKQTSYYTVRIVLEYTQKYGFQCQFQIPTILASHANSIPTTDYQCQYSEFPTILDSCSKSSATERKGEKGGQNCVGRIYGGRKKEACISVQALGAKNNEGGDLYL
ncbi:hypothetical protein Lal_00037794 [Lupinus albus]|nr:hypothetical protein Lal_00037794 [Lupinus albus]